MLNICKPDCRVRQSDTLKMLQYNTAQTVLVNESEFTEIETDIRSFETLCNRNILGFCYRAIIHCSNDYSEIDLHVTMNRRKFNWKLVEQLLFTAHDSMNVQADKIAKTNKFAFIVSANMYLRLYSFQGLFYGIDAFKTQKYHFQMT